jgi:hypothetical protein
VSQAHTTDRIPDVTITTPPVEPFMLDFDDIFGRYIEANQKKWAHDRSLTVGASEIFDCERKAWFTKLGKKHGHAPDEEYEEDWGALERGNIIENNFVVPAVRHHMPEGIKVLYTGDDQETLVADHNSATPDGLITGLPKGCAVRVKAGTQDIVIDDIKSDCICLEIKSIDPRATLLEERAKHHGQTQVQLGLFHEKTQWRPYYSIVLYIDASFLSKLTPFVVEYDPNIYAEAKSRAARIYGASDPMDLTAEGRFSGACQHCKWKVACGTAQVGAIPKYDVDPNATPETVAAADALVAVFLKKKQEAEAAEKAQKLASQAIKDFLSSRNVRKLSSPDWSATWYPSDGKKTYDIDAMSADGIDVVAYEKQGAPFDVLRITPKKIKAKE